MWQEDRNLIIKSAKGTNENLFRVSNDVIKLCRVSASLVR